MESKLVNASVDILRIDDNSESNEFRYNKAIDLVPAEQAFCRWWKYEISSLLYGSKSMR